MSFALTPAEDGGRVQRMRVATVDIGTNSVLLLVSERVQAGDANVFRVIADYATVTRLGQGVDASGVLAPEAIARTVECLREYGELARAAGVSAAVVVGTSALRDAGGSAQIAAAVRACFATDLRVIAGEEEATVTYLGARSGLRAYADDVVFDVGGGSTEFVQRAPTGELGLHVSLPIGCVRMTERHLHHDPPRASELAALRADVANQLAQLAKPATAHAPVGIAGTVTTLCAVQLQLASYDGAAVHGAELTLAQVTALALQLAAMDVESRRVLPGLHPKRADVVIAGALIVEEIMMWLGATSMRVSDRGVRYGLALQALGLSDESARPARG